MRGAHVIAMAVIAMTLELHRGLLIVTFTSDLRAEQSIVGGLDARGDSKAQKKNTHMAFKA